MKFVFNESLISTVGSEITSDPMINKFISSGIILEKRVVVATISSMDDLFRKLDAIPNEPAQRRFLISNEVKDFLKIGDNEEEFYRRYNAYLRRQNTTQSNTPNQGSNVTDFIRDQISNAASAAEDPASKFAPYLETKDQIIQRLKPFMSEDEMGEIFKQIEEQLPFDQVIGILDYCISKSRSCNARAADLIKFFIEHYGQKRQYALTKTLISQACDYQKLNPTIDIFQVMRDATAGNQPNVNLGYLSKDRDDQKIFNNLIMLSQSSLPEQDEEIRRRFQESRDALDSKTTKFNMQRAIFDMMKIEESNKELGKMIDGMGDLFKSLITSPMYRALRDIYYDLRAGRILAEQGASIFIADPSPQNKRSKPTEDMYHRGSDQFPQFPDPRETFSDSDYKFLKLASPEVSRYIYSQNQSNPFANILNNIVTAIKNGYESIVGKAQEIGQFFTLIKQLFDALVSAASNIGQRILSGNITLEFITSEFEKITNVLFSQKFATRNLKFTKHAQHTVQPQNVVVPQNSANAGKVFNVIAGISAVISSLVAAGELSGAFNSGKWLKAANMLAPLVLGIKNVYIELAVQSNPKLGNRSPRSDYYFDQNGQLSEIGKQRLANNQETMIALGIADQDAMALSKFSVQKEYLMKQLRTKEENLKSAEQQVVQLGGAKTDYTVGDLPEDFQKKLKDFLDFCTKIEPQFKAALNIFKNASKNMQNLSPDQQTQATGLLAEFESDLIEIQKKKSEWSSMKNIAAHLMRKRILLQKLKPLQAQMDTMKKLGIPISNIIASPNGILAQVGKIRNEEQQALEKLRQEYDEKIELLKNPDKILPMVKYPTDTGVTKLPQSPDQSPSDKSPFDAEKGSQFETIEEKNVS